MLKKSSPAGRPLLASLRALVLCLALTLCVAPICGAQSGPLEDLATFPRTTLNIMHGKTKNDPGNRHFDIWIADTPARQEQGLMFVRDLPASQGMLFPLPKPRVMTMWMKNTYVELDMVFVGVKGTIVKIIPRAHPLSLETLDSEQPVSAVLEIRGGEAAKLGLQVGDRVSWSAVAG
jgi:uncharacterized membrane protein (UPF0127 family)